MADRAVSDVLGFILVFSLIALTVGIVSITGFAGLGDRQDAEQVNNAERAFEILADNIEDIYLRGVPSRSTEIELAGAQLSSTEKTTVSVTITNLGGQPSTKDVLYPITYSAPGGATLVYENGAVFREDPNGGTVMKRKPNVVFSDRGDPKTAILPFILTSKADADIGGQTTALIRAESLGSEVLNRYNDPATQYTVQLRITTSPERVVIWQEYLNEEIKEAYGSSAACDPPPASDTVVCVEFSVNRVTITATSIDIQFE